MATFTAAVVDIMVVMYIQAMGRIRMIGAMHFFADRKSALVEPPRCRSIALDVKEDGEIAETRDCPEMLRAKQFLVQCQRALL